MDDDLAYFLDLRIRLRGRAEALAIVDRCIGLVARAQHASPAEVAALAREAAALRADLEARFGIRKPLRVH
jgi:hypothetical protein